MPHPGPPDQSLLDALARHAAQRPEATACRSGARTLTYAELDRHSSQIAQALATAGVARGDRVACLTKQHAQCLLLTLAALKLGAVCMPVNWRLAPAEVAYILDHGRARVVLADAGFLPVLRPADVPAGGPLWLCTEQAAAGCAGFADWYAGQPAHIDTPRAAPDDAALQLYSSGTTGLPKGVVLSHRGLLSTSRTVSADWRFGADDVLGNPLPTFHVAGMTMLLLALYTGGCSVTFADFDPADYCRAIARHGITHSFLVPAMILFMLQQPDVAAADYRGLRLIAYGGSPITETVLQRAMAVFGCDFLQVYGLTEVSGPGTFLMPEDHRRVAQQPGLLRSAGRPAGGARLRIVDPVSGADLPEGATGEVWIETERNLLEYFRNPEATAQAFPEGRDANGGWFRTGDGGYLQDGYLYINDRIKDMIISGGENIYPAEIENLLSKHPAVADGAIIGVPDATWGEAVKACVVLQPGAQVAEAALIAWMRERLAHYKCPKSIDFVTELPRNPSGKVLKRLLRQPYWQGQTRGVH